MANLVFNGLVALPVALRRRWAKCVASSCPPRLLPANTVSCAVVSWHRAVPESGKVVKSGFGSRWNFLVAQEIHSVIFVEFHSSGSVKTKTMNKIKQDQKTLVSKINVGELEDLGDDDIALGPHIEVKTCDRFRTDDGFQSKPVTGFYFT